MKSEPTLQRKRSAQPMPYVSGVLTGIVLTVLAVFLIDHLRPEPDTRDIVNWDYVGESLGASIEKVGEEVRQEVHESTAPEGAATGPTATAKDSEQGFSMRAVAGSSSRRGEVKSRDSTRAAMSA